MAWKCPICSRTLPIEAGDPKYYPIRCSCGFVDHGDKHNKPGPLTRAANFGKALIEHKRNGNPKASKAEIQARFETCKPCERFDGEMCRHPKCGCSVNNVTQFRNKLAWADQSCPMGKWGPARSAPLETKLTACITYYMRKASLDRLLASLKKHYPRLGIIVQDTEGNLSWGRNRLAQRCETPFYLMLEEDMEVTQATHLEWLVSILEHDDEIGGAGGQLDEDRGPVWWCHNFRPFRDRVDAVYSSEPVRVTPWGVAYRPCDLLVNFGVFRRELFVDTEWDEDLELYEHRDFYYRSSRKKRFKMAYAPQVQIAHHKDRPTNEYNASRGRARNYEAVIQQKHGIRFTLPENNKHDHRTEAPNIVVLGPGNSGTSAVMAQLAAGGYDVGPIGPVAWSNANGSIEERITYEHPDIVAANMTRDITGGGKILDTLRRPWAIKDPRFCETLELWLPALARHAPTLLVVDKDEEAVRASWSRRGAAMDRLDLRLAAIERIYRGWPWQKIRVDLDGLGRWTAGRTSEVSQP